MAGIVVDVDGWFYVTDHEGKKISPPISSLEEACDLMLEKRLELYEENEHKLLIPYEIRVLRLTGVGIPKMGLPTMVGV